MTIFIEDGSDRTITIDSSVQHIRLTPDVQVEMSDKLEVDDCGENNIDFSPLLPEKEGDSMTEKCDVPTGPDYKKESNIDLLKKRVAELEHACADLETMRACCACIPELIARLKITEDEVWKTS